MARTGLGKFLKHLRKSRGHHAQGSLAEALGCSVPRVSRWETGHAIPTQYWEARLAGVLELDETELAVLSSLISEQALVAGPRVAA